MNIQASQLAEHLNFNTDKPATHMLYQNDHHKQLLIGLLKGQVLSKHMTTLYTRLLVLQGSIQFNYEGSSLTAKPLDSFIIPKEMLHEVIGQDEQNVFILLQDK
jgi:quercetin dioxygenase-like cupin family protein